MAQQPFADAVYLNFASMHGVQPVLSSIEKLAQTRLAANKRPRLSWFENLAKMETPEEFSPMELPFRVYLITGNAGSGKSTCIQAINETLNCVITGSTRVAALNVFNKLTASYTCQRIQTIFHEFGFRGNHVQTALGRFVYTPGSDPPSVADLQARDLVYYWDVIIDITRRALSDAAPVALSVLRVLESITGKEYTALAPFISSSIPSFGQTNVIVVDEAGVLGRHLLTVIVYCWWLLNAALQTRLYSEGRMPVVVCIGSPTQTDSMESTFEHNTQRQLVQSSVNILTHVICTPTLTRYLELDNHWTIFINNKRCTEVEFGDMLKAFEFGLDMTERHASYLDQFVVPESYIKDPAKLVGWTRLFTSHEEVKTYMTKLHANLRAQKSDKFVVFSLPVYILVRMECFEEYKRLTGQTSLTLEKWLSAHNSRLSNYSQSRDHDTTLPQFEYHSGEAGRLAVIRHDVTHVLNSQVTVTAKVRKWVFGFEGTFEGFLHVLTEDTFFKKQGDNQVEYAYRFISTLLFSGMVKFYDFLCTPGLDPDKVTSAYEKLFALTGQVVPPSGGASTHRVAPDAGPASRGGGELYVWGSDGGEDGDVIFEGLLEKTIDQFYLTYESRPCDHQGSEIYCHFDYLKRLFMLRYALLDDLFGAVFSASRFDTFVSNVAFNGSTVAAASFKGGLVSYAVQTDCYTLRGITRSVVPAFNEEMAHRRMHEGTTTVLRSMDLPRVVLRDALGFVSVLNLNVNEFVDSLDDKELPMATTVDHGLSSNLAMTITRSQGLSLDRVAICFSSGPIKLNTAYVAMSRVVSSRHLRMNVNPLRTRYEDTRGVSSYILRAMRTPEVRLVY